MSGTSKTDRDSIVHKSKRLRFRAGFTSSGWLYFGLVCLIMSYLLIWQRGYYMDDYPHRNTVVDPVTRAQTRVTSLSLPQFPVRMLSGPVTWFYLSNIPEHEFLIRTFSALIQGLNALLLGLIIYRALRSKLAAVAGGWLFLFPVFAAEAVLWNTVPIYVLGATFALLFILTFQSTLTDKHQPMRLPIIGGVAFALMLFFIEAYVAVYGLVILFGGAMLAELRPPERARMLKRIVLFVVPSTLVLGLFVLGYRYSNFISSRGGVDFNLPHLLARAQDYLSTLVWMTVSSKWGMVLLQVSFSRGIDVLLSSWKGLLLLGLASILLVLTVLSWSAGEQSFKPRYRAGVMLFIIGVTWMFVTILFPGTFGKQQLLEYRMLYFPSAGASVAVAALFWLASRALRSHKIWDKFLIGVAGVVMLASSITMLGYARLFALRNSDDQLHISAIVNTIPSEYLPAGTYIVPYKFDKATATSRRLLAGVFETPWSAHAALAAAYRRRDLKVVITNRWVDWRFTFDAMAPLNYRLKIQTVPVPIDKTLIIASENGRALPVKSLSIVMQDGSRNAVAFPIAEDLAKHGVQVLETLTVQSTP